MLLELQVRGVLRRLRQAWKALRGDQPAALPARTSGLAQRWSTSPLFDADFYAVQVGRPAVDAEAAAQHFVTHGMAQGRWPHPAIDPTELPDQIRRAYRSKGAATVLDHLEATHASAPALDDAERRAMVEGAAEIARVEKIWHRPSMARWDEKSERTFRASEVARPLDDAPSVDVVMSVKNGAATIGAAIASIQAQDHQDWTLWVVDDGSTDTTADVVRSLTAKDQRIQLVVNQGSGVTDARNTGIGNAEGSVVAFLDADNTWRPDMLSLSVAALVRSESAWVYCAMRLDNRSGGIQYLGIEGGLDALLLRNHVDLNTLVARTDVVREVGGFSTDLRRWVDHELAIKLAEHSDPLYLPFIGCDYDNSPSPNRISRRESPSWEFVVIGRHALRRIERPAPVPGRWSVLMHTSDDPAADVEAITTALSTADIDGVDVEVVVLDAGSAVPWAMKLVSTAAADPRVVVVRHPRDYSPALMYSYAQAHATGEKLLFLPPGGCLDPEAFDGLDEALSGEVVGAQPVVIHNGAVVAAGLHRIAGHDEPVAVWRNLRPADLDELAGQPVQATTGGLTARRSDIEAVGGLDLRISGRAAIPDLGRRLASRGRVVLADAHIEVSNESGTDLDPWADGDQAAGLAAWRDDDAASVDPDALVGPLGLRVAAVTPHVVEGQWTLCAALAPTRRRWAVKVGPDESFDTQEFAQDLSVALEQHGERVDFVREDSSGGPASVDSVVVAVRGKSPVPRIPGTVHFVCVVDGDALIRPFDLDVADHVWVADEPWADTLPTTSAPVGRVDTIVDAAAQMIAEAGRVSPSPSADGR